MMQSPRSGHDTTAAPIVRAQTQAVKGVTFVTRKMLTLQILHGSDSEDVGWYIYKERCRVRSKKLGKPGNFEVPPGIQSRKRQRFTTGDRAHEKVIL
jgi:hypothetical protein